MSASCQRLRDAICNCECNYIQPCFPSPPYPVPSTPSHPDTMFPVLFNSWPRLIGSEWPRDSDHMCSVENVEHVNFHKVHVNLNKSEKIRGVIKEEKTCCWMKFGSRW